MLDWRRAKPALGSNGWLTGWETGACELFWLLLLVSEVPRTELKMPLMM